MRQLKPHSLSYQAMILTSVPPITIVIEESMIDERLSSRKSDDLASVDDQRIIGMSDGARIGSVRGVVLEQQPVHFGVDQVVDCDHFGVRGALDEGPERLAADPPKP